MYQIGHIKEENLENLKKYQYRGVDKSILSNYVLGEYWNFVVKFVPLWVAPNMVTLFGFGLIAFGFVLNMVYAPNLIEEMPSWVYIVQGVCIWGYSTLDAIDGKQARRTGQSGPLGELFDHGCDSITTTLVMLMFATSLQWGRGPRTLICLMFGYANFYVATLEEFYTGELYMAYFTGAVEGLAINSLTALLIGVFGTKIATTPVFSIIFGSGVAAATSSNTSANLLSILTNLKNISFSDFAFAFMSVGIIPTLFACYKHIYVKNNRNVNIMVDAVVDTVPILLIVASMALNLGHETSIMRYLCYGLSLSYVVGQVILGHITKNKKAISPVALAHIPHVLLILSNSMTSDLIAFGLLLFLYSSLVRNVIRQITEYLDIYCLSIKHPKTF